MAIRHPKRRGANVDISALSPGTAGELITWGATGVPEAVAVGTATHVLTSNGVGLAPTFQASAGGVSGDTPLDISGDINLATPPVEAAYTALLRFVGNDGSDVASTVGHDGSGALNIRQLVTNANMNFYVEDFVGTSDLAMQIDGGRSTSDYRKRSTVMFDTIKCGTTATMGFSEEDPPFSVIEAGLGNTGETVSRVVIWPQGIIQAYSTGLTTTDLNLQTQGGAVDMHQADNVDLGHLGIKLAETTTAAAGGFLVNNTLTGAGVERVLTTSDLGGGTVELDEQLATGITNGYVLTADGANGAAWLAAGAGSQTPWTANVDAAGYTLTDVSAITSTGTLTGTRAWLTATDSHLRMFDSDDSIDTADFTQIQRNQLFTSIHHYDDSTATYNVLLKMTDAGVVTWDAMTSMVLPATVTATTFNAVALTAAGASTDYLSADGTYSAPSGGGSQTPWTGNIDAATFTLTDVGTIEVSEGPVDIIGSTDGASLITVTNTGATHTGGGGGFRIRSNDGAAMASGHRLGWVIFAGAEDASNTFNYSSLIESYALESWTGSANGADLRFTTTPIGSSTRATSLTVASEQITVAPTIMRMDTTDSVFEIAETTGSPSGTASSGQYIANAENWNGVFPAFVDENSLKWHMANFDGHYFSFEQSITASDPTAGHMRWDSATPGSVTELYIDDTDNMGQANHKWLSHLADGDFIRMTDGITDSTVWYATVNGTPTDNTGWWTVPVTTVFGNTRPLDQNPVQIEIQWLSQGPAGAGSQTPWTSDIDGGGYGLDNIDRLLIHEPGNAADNLTITHDGTDVQFTFAQTNFADFSGLAAVRYLNARLDFSNSNYASSFSSHFNHGTEGNHYLTSHSTGFMIWRTWQTGTTFRNVLKVDQDDLTIDSNCNAQLDGGITVVDTASFSVSTAGALTTDETITAADMTLSSTLDVEGVVSMNLTGAPQLIFTGTGGPFGIQWAGDAMTAADHVSLVYRTGPKTLTFERISDSADILVLDPLALDVTIGNDLAVGGDVNTTGAVNMGAASLLSGSTTANAKFSIDHTGASNTSAGGGLRLRQDDGAAMASGHQLGYILFAGAEDTSSTFNYSATIEAFATENWSGSANGANLIFKTTALGATTRAASMTLTDLDLEIASAHITMGAAGPTWEVGSGTPESAVTAPIGSLFTRTDGGTSTTLYVKETGTGNTGWVAK